MNRSKDEWNYKQKTLKRSGKHPTNFKHWDKASDSVNGKRTRQKYCNYKIGSNRSKKLITPRNSEGVTQTLIENMVNNQAKLSRA